MENTYQNLCTSELYIISIEKMIQKKGTFECEENDEMKKLVKDNKLVNYGKDAIADEIKETKPVKKGRKKKTSELEDNSKQEDNQETNAGGAF